MTYDRLSWKLTRPPKTAIRWKLLFVARSICAGYRSTLQQNFETLFRLVDKLMFCKILDIPDHLLLRFLPLVSTVSRNYSLRTRHASWIIILSYKCCSVLQCLLTFHAVFTALHVMQPRYCDEISVRPSVRLSVTRVNCDKTEERSVQIYIPYERTFILVFREDRMVGGGRRPFLPEILGQPTPIGTKSPIFNQ